MVFTSASLPPPMLCCSRHCHCHCHCHCNCHCHYHCHYHYHYHYHCTRWQDYPSRRSNIARYRCRWHYYSSSGSTLDGLHKCLAAASNALLLLPLPLPLPLTTAPAGKDFPPGVAISSVFAPAGIIILPAAAPWMVFTSASPPTPMLCCSCHCHCHCSRWQGFSC